MKGWRTVPTSLRVLLVIHSATAATRLADLLPIFEDPHLQVFCTQTSDSMFPEGIRSFVDFHGFPFLEWDQAVRIEFDAVITASLGDNLHEIKSPILRIPHGNGYNKLWSPEPGARSPEPGARSPEPGARSPEPGARTFGLSEATLKHDGRLVPAAIGLSHAEQLDRLAEECPEAVPRAFIAGDPCYDRIKASLPKLWHYRNSLNLHRDQKLITVASTWREDSLYGIDPLLVSRLLDEFPYDQFRVALLLHPNVWASHGEGMVKAWLADARRAGLKVFPWHAEWRAAIIAADWVLSDHGSVSVYAAAAGRPVLLDHSGRHSVDPRSGLGQLMAVAPVLDPRAPIAPQLRAAEKQRERTRAVAARWVSSAPDCSLRLIQNKLYQLMNAKPPEDLPRLEPVSSRKLDTDRPAALWTRVDPGDGPREFRVQRWPASVSRRSGVLVVAEDQELDHRLLSQADILHLTGDIPVRDAEDWSAAVFEHRLGAGVAFVQTARQARFQTREGQVFSVVLDPSDSPDDDLVFAVLAERLLTGTGSLSALSPLTLRLGPDRSVRATFRVHPY